ncbi:MAG TPA: YjbQ family protein [Gaiellaceae bacterium]|nr:YjbQ family protein [Gaiellaceae bacterium]
MIRCRPRTKSLQSGTSPVATPQFHSNGEDDADAQLKRQLMGHQVVLAITDGGLDLGPWEQVFYAEFDGRRRKRVLLKAIGD